jgi:hypothetical protein
MSPFDFLVSLLNVGCKLMNKLTTKLEFLSFITLDLDLKGLHWDRVLVGFYGISRGLENIDIHVSFERLSITKTFYSFKIDLSCTKKSFFKTKVEIVRTFDLKDTLELFFKLWER